MSAQRRKLAAVFKWASFALLFVGGVIAENGAMTADKKELGIAAIGAGMAVVFMILWDRLMRD